MLRNGDSSVQCNKWFDVVSTLVRKPPIRGNTFLPINCVITLEVCFIRLLPILLPINIIIFIGRQQR